MELSLGSRAWECVSYENAELPRCQWLSALLALSHFHHGAQQQDQVVQFWSEPHWAGAVMCFQPSPPPPGGTDRLELSHGGCQGREVERSRDWPKDTGLDSCMPGVKLTPARVGAPGLCSGQWAFLRHGQVPPPLLAT